jgi:hypothetical protein
MVGNLWEWAGDWTTNADDCTNWSAGLGSDIACFGGPGSTFSTIFPAWRDAAVAGARRPTPASSR